ncbi:MAG: cysteine protease StiP family protein [Micrococcales bacterium]|nr:cysteine protease StiP family protein [Micrococcales bacterium]
MPEPTPEPLAPEPPTRLQPLVGPGFGSYSGRDVQWLLSDISHVTGIERPTAEREEAIAQHGAHYAESLPVEYQPEPEYLEQFHRALRTEAVELAVEVEALGLQVLAAKGPDVVLVSLARAGVPVGILVRRWLARHGVQAPHFAVSIVRGRGIDTAALDWLTARYRPGDLVFVDGWTGKGAITRELTQAVETYRAQTGLEIDPRLAVLADPGRCATWYGTRADQLVPSACLNSTVSGLVSRTVLNDTVIAPGMFHGAKFYRHLAAADRSRHFVDTVVAAAEGLDSTAGAARVAALDAQPGAHRLLMTGWDTTARVAQAYGIDDLNLVKPGIGETTRVLLRRVPWKVVVRPGADRARLGHVLMLADARGVDVEASDLLDGYDCVGIIHPDFTRGATGADGRST